jgi:hypothetical protein
MTLNFSDFNIKTQKSAINWQFSTHIKTLTPSFCFQVSFDQGVANGPYLSISNFERYQLPKIDSNICEFNS